MSKQLNSLAIVKGLLKKFAMNVKKETKLPIYIGEGVKVAFNNNPVFHRKPVCPDNFIWKGQNFSIVESLSEWQDFSRRGKYRFNIKEAHKIRASIKGSYGVGRYYFRIRTKESRIFDLYFDRATATESDSSLDWVLFQEVFIFD